MSAPLVNLSFRVTRSKRVIDDLPKAIGIRVKRAFRDFGMDFLRKMKTERLRGRPGLAKRTGELARSFQMSLAGETLADAKLRIWTTSPYAKIHEYGGTIRPVKGKWLTIPLPGAATKAGVARGGARDFENTFFAWSKNGNLILFQKGKGKKGKPTPLFVLKEEVTIPARLGFRALWSSTALERKIRVREAVRVAMGR